jgi:hypothetical protein
MLRRSRSRRERTYTLVAYLDDESKHENPLPMK